jgi:hypothetical protein
MLNGKALDGATLTRRFGGARPVFLRAAGARFGGGAWFCVEFERDRLL